MQTSSCMSDKWTGGGDKVTVVHLCFALYFSSHAFFTSQKKSLHLLMECCLSSVHIHTFSPSFTDRVYYNVSFIWECTATCHVGVNRLCTQCLFGATMLRVNIMTWSKHTAFPFPSAVSCFGNIYTSGGQFSLYRWLNCSP